VQIYFEDHGQDFNRWTLDSDGVVVESFPFQNRLWRGCRVLWHAQLRVGDCLIYRTADGKHTHNIRYPIVRIERTEARP
jgi:hypothetical protein